MKIAMICPFPLKSSLGAAKVYMENTNCYKELGHDVTLYGPEEFTHLPEADPSFLKEYSLALFEFIKENANHFDVIEYEYLYLPYDRKLLPKSCLLVARSILLELHLSKIQIPRFKTLRSMVGLLVKGGQRRKRLKSRMGSALRTLKEADAVTVANDWDKKMLVSLSIDEPKIQVAPYGLSEKRMKALEVINRDESSFCVGFVGTFDPRKGAVEFPKLWKKVVEAVPKARLKLMGTSSMFPDAESVKNHFSKEVRHTIDVVESFSAEDLPSLLKDCHCGVFPSYLESFGFGVLEMMAASLPVAAYRTPGPEMLVDKTWLSEQGNWSSLAEQIVSWAQDPSLLADDQLKARERSKLFNWMDSCKKALAIYEEKVAELNLANTSHLSDLS